MAEWRPVLRGQQLHQIALDFFGIGLHGQTHAATEPADVRVNRDAGYVVCIAENHVRRLAADARKLDERSEVVRHFTAVLLNDSPAALLNAFRFGSEKTRRLDQVFELAAISLGERLRVRIASE